MLKLNKKLAKIVANHLDYAHHTMLKSITSDLEIQVNANDSHDYVAYLDAIDSYCKKDLTNLIKVITIIERRTV